MKSIVLIALLGNLYAVQISQGTHNKIYSKFIAGDFDNDDDTYVEEIPKPSRRGHRKLKNHLRLNVKNDINMGSGAASDPIWGSLGPSENTDADFQTEEGIIERDLRARKAQKYTLDPDEHPETQDSIAWAEKALKAKLTPPKRTPFEIEMDKLNDDHKFNYETEQDQDITDTLANAELAEKQVNNRYNRYGYGGYGYGGGGYGSYWNRGNQDKDWWTGLVKDNGKEGMISTTAKAQRYGYGGYGGRYGSNTYKNYDEMAAQYVKEREEKISKDKKKNMSKKDKEAAKELKDATEGEGGDDDKKDDDKKDDDKKEEGGDEGKKEKGGDDEKKDDDKGDEKEASKELPPELAESEEKKPALSQKSKKAHHLHHLLQKKKKKHHHEEEEEEEAKNDDDNTFEKNAAGKDVIDIGGEKIILGPLGEEDAQVDDDLRSQELISYLQTQDLETDSLIELQLSNQEKLERVIRSGL